MAALAGEMGFAHWSFMATAPALGHGDRATWAMNELPVDLDPAQIGRQIGQSPEAAERLRSGIPQWWCVRPPIAASAGPAGDAPGTYSGLSVGVRDGADIEGLVSLAAPGLLGVAVLQAARAAALLFARCTYLACLPHIERFREGLVPPLSTREVACLSWAAQGKTAWETSCLLGISRHTVTFHLRNAALKLGATGRQQAITKSIRMGLLRTERQHGTAGRP
jgi:DNA-binding CsgD family transcriptional regulator